MLINTLFDFGRAVHDSLDVLSPSAETLRRGALLVRFIKKVDFGRDLEQQLNFYVECRSRSLLFRFPFLFLFLLLDLKWIQSGIL